MATLNIDENRFLIKKASKENITGKWEEVVNEMVKTCKEHLGDHLISVYVGGSVAHGEAVDVKSDIDLYAITDLNDEKIKEAQNSWVNPEMDRLNKLYPFQRGAEINLFFIDKLPEGKKLQMKVFATNVWGKDFDTELPPIRLDKETCARVRLSMKRDIDIARGKLDTVSDVKEINKIGFEIAKRLIRSAGMMCMWRVDFYTMETDKLVDMFISFYPEKAKEMRDLYEFEKNPPSDKEEILAMFDSFGEWLMEEDRRIFGQI
jgi:hypothetical protein